MAATGGVNGGGDDAATKADKLNTVRAVAAMAALVGFAVFVLFMIDNADAKESTWKNYVYVFTGVEAIVFAAVGWLFGRQIARPVVEQAKEAGKAKEKAAREEEKGRSIARMVIAEGSGSRLQGMGGSSSQPSAVAAFARAQYPDL